MIQLVQRHRQQHSKRQFASAAVSGWPPSDTEIHRSNRFALISIRNLLIIVMTSFIIDGLGKHAALRNRTMRAGAGAGSESRLLIVTVERLPWTSCKIRTLQTR